MNLIFIEPFVKCSSFFNNQFIRKPTKYIEFSVNHLKCARTHIILKFNILLCNTQHLAVASMDTIKDTNCDNYRNIRAIH